jgi:hypothetical protein
LQFSATEDVVSFAFRGEAHRTQMATAVCITFQLRIRIRRRPFAKQLTLCEARAEEHASFTPVNGFGKGRFLMPKTLENLNQLTF